MTIAFKKTLLLIALLMGFGGAFAQSYLKWDQLPALPNSGGLAGPFAGTSNGALLVAGGSNFPKGEAPWTGGKKTWFKTIWVLERPTGTWKVGGNLTNGMAYGASVSWKDGLICIGGNDADRSYSDVFVLRFNNGKVATEQLPSLPCPVSNATAVLINDVIYVCGGIRDPLAKTAERNFWALDMNAQKRSWKSLDPWPGPARMLSVVGTQDGALYLFSGVELVAVNDEPAQRVYLKDAYQYIPATGWKRIKDLPRAVAAAPSPALAGGQSMLLLLGGDDGKYFKDNASLKEKHPGFSNDVLSYNTITDTWALIDTMPHKKYPNSVERPEESIWAPVTTPLVMWNDQFIIPAGEIRPATRTSRVLMGGFIQPSGAFKILDWTVVGLYFLLIIGISVYVSRKMKNTTSDFFLGGGKIPWWAAGLSIFGSKLSALTFIAIPAKAYATDWVYFLGNMMIVAVAPVIVYFYLPYFRKLKITSVYEFLEVRFNFTVRLLGSLNFVIYQISRLGIVIYLPAMVLSTVTGLNLYVCIIGTGLITTAYSVAGGIEAVIWTEVIQVGVLLGGALLSLVFIANSIHGGFGQIFNEAMAGQKLRLAILNWHAAEPVLWVVFIGGFFTQLVTYSSDQVVVQRYLTTSTEQEARQSIYTNAVLVVPASLIFFSVGTALWVYFKHHPSYLNPNGRIDDVFPWFISQRLPSGLAGLVIAGLFAATMSTISSSMNSIATVLTTDFYKPWRPSTSDKQSFVFARWITFLLGVIGCLIAVYLASLQNASILDEYFKIIGLLGGCLAGMFVAGIFLPRVKSRDILIGFFSSAVVLFAIQSTGTINFFLYPVIAITICVFVAYLCSYITPSPTAKNTS
jgi:SSS family solute:Na+ symporter